MITLEKEELPDSNWNKRLESSGLGTIYQAAEIAQHHIHEGRKPLCLKFISDNEGIAGQLLMSEYERFTNTSLKTNILKKIPNIKKMSFSWTYGPIIFDRTSSNEIYSVLSKFLISSKHIVSGWQHPLYTDGIDGLDKKFKLMPWSTFIIDLTLSKDELYSNIDKHSGRKNIERATQRGVVVEEINDENFIEYAKLRQAQETDSNEKSDLEQRKEWWHSVKKLGYLGLLAKKDSNAVSGILFSAFNGHIIEVGVARSPEDSKNNLYSQDLLKWKIIEWGKNNNMKYYNLAGFNPNPQSKKEEGIFKYKKKWGGKRYDFWRIVGR